MPSDVVKSAQGGRSAGTGNEQVGSGTVKSVRPEVGALQ